MSGNSLFADTNILLYLVAGDETVAELLSGKNVFISFITELELLGYKDLQDTERAVIQELIKDTTIIGINDEIKKRVIDIRASHTIKLPDAIIAASALFTNLPLVSADKQLAQVNELNLLLYKK